MSTPINKSLWEKARKAADKVYNRPSAYKSGYIVKKYKEYGGKFKEQSKTKAGLTRWFAEEWTNQRKETGYKYKSDVYRPTKRITKDTPKTWAELTPTQVKRARSIKAKKKRIIKF
jgi:hypothetical protein